MKVLPHPVPRVAIPLLTALLTTGGITMVSPSAAGQRSSERAGLVDPLIGTGGHGHTFPGATVPFGMVQLSPDTRVNGWDACGGYHYSDSVILGFSHTHLSGTGVADYGDVLFMPSRGTPMMDPGSDAPRRTGYRSRFSHTDERAAPGYYAVLLRDWNIRAELTATVRTGIHRYTFLESDTANIVVNLQHGLGPDRVTASMVDFVSGREIAGFRRSSGWAKDQHVYFVARFSRPFLARGRTAGRSDDGETGIKAYVRFLVKAGESIMVKVGISSVSIDAARRNLDAEASSWDFDRYVKQARGLWEKELGKIRIDGGTREQRVTFYTALYHSMIAPNVFSDVDGRYRGMDGEIHTARGFTMYTVFSLWDTFRALHPLLSIIDRKRTADFVRSLLAKQNESGILPVWELASNETWCMIGYHAVPVIVDAWAKGIHPSDTRSTLDAMVHSATRDHFGLEAYRRFGYIPGDSEGESVSKTLEYAYDDWCIAHFAISTGNVKEYEAFSRRAQSYRNLFDADSKTMRPKINSRWVSPFDPTSVTVHYTEANPWQYSFFAPHDVDGLIDLYGGKEAFAAQLDRMFESPARLTGRDQADITGLIGQYAHGNEPSHHAAWLYHHVGMPWKTQGYVRRILDSLYGPGPDGLCGNDDCGQMSAWYVMNALGFYQICPGLPVFSIIAPRFPSATLHMENGKTFSIRCDMNPSAKPFIRSVSLNGKPHPFSSIQYDDMMGGSTLAFGLGDTPDRSWGATDPHMPHSMPMPPTTTVPFFDAESDSFTDTMTVRIVSPDVSATIMYSTDALAGTGAFVPYRKPLPLDTTTTVRAFVRGPDGSPSPVVVGTFRKHVRMGTISISSPYAEQYAAGGNDALIDGLRGGVDFRLGAWQGYEGVDIDAVVDLGASRRIREVSLGCLQDNNSWIFFPEYVEFAFSEDGQAFTGTVRSTNRISPKQEGGLIHEFSVPLALGARYVRVRAKSIGICPSWHRGAGGKAWLFADEIAVRTEE